MAKSVEGAIKTGASANGKKYYKNARKGLHCPEQFLFIQPMFSKINLALGTALGAIALGFFVESSLAQEALTPPAISTDNDGVDDTDADERLMPKSSSLQERSTFIPWSILHSLQSKAPESMPARKLRS